MIFISARLRYMESLTNLIRRDQNVSPAFRAALPVSRMAKDIDLREFGPEAHHEERTDWTEERCGHCAREFFADQFVATRVNGETVSLCFKCILACEVTQ